MQLTHLGHAAVLVDTGGRRLLIDPGNFSTAWHGLDDLDAVLITHQHPDHVDPEQIGGLLAANPRARVIVEPQTLAAVDLDERAEALAADGVLDLGGVTVSAVGGTHAVIHRDLPMIGNVGLIVEAEGEPRLFHPGDSLASVPEGIDILAVPAMGPWAAMKETIDFVRAVGAPQGFAIHDELLSERGRSLIRGRIEAMTDTHLDDLRDGRPRHY